MSSFRLKLDPEAISDLADLDAVRDQSRDGAQAVVDEIQASAPVQSGDYRDSWEVIELDDGFGAATNSSIWHLLEYGTIDQPALRIAEDAARAAGFEFEAL